MREFFRGWKRKLGVLTLLMALVLMAGWVRNFVVEDYFDFPIENRTITGVGTERQSLVFYKNANAADVDRTEPAPKLRELTDDVTGDFETNEDWEVTSHGVYQIAPFEITISCSFPEPVPIVEIPFVVIVVPLSVLSAYLLLSKPASPGPKSTGEPAPAGET